MGYSFDRFLENVPSVGYSAFSHLINLLALVGYLVSDVWVFANLYVTLPPD
jgi:hypothetical protein